MWPCPSCWGVNSPQYTEEELRAFREENAKGITYEGRRYTGYEATQKQRQIERAQRKQKRRILVADTTGDAVSKQTALIWLRMFNQHYKAFSKTVGLPLQEEWAWVVGHHAKKHLIENHGYNNSQSHTLNQKDRGKKVFITDIAIDKVHKVTFNGVRDEIADQIQQTHKELLRFAKEQNNSKEVASLLDIKTGERLPFVKGDQILVNIEADADSYHWLRTKPKQSIMLLHNHPEQSCFSMNDLFVFFHYPQIETMTIVTSQGKVWWIKKTEKYNSNTPEKIVEEAEQIDQGDYGKKVAYILGKCYNYGIKRG